MSIDQAFMQHVTMNGLSYGTLAEFEFRRDIFAERDAEMNEIMAENGTSTVGHNFLSTWTHEEKQRLLGYRAGDNGFLETAPESNAPMAETVNWVTAGKVSPVQNQASCGSCWAFSATCAMETAYAIKNQCSPPKLSEEELVQCDTYSAGCNGGNMGYAFVWLESHNFNTEANYPYTSGGGVTGSCNSSKETGSVKATGAYQVTANSPSALKSAINDRAVSVSIEADKTVFQHYTGGVLTSSRCGTQLDHGVVAVGYGTEGGQEYYLVRNSWGPTWGLDGYIKIGVEDGKGVCGIQMDSSFPETN